MVCFVRRRRGALHIYVQNHPRYDFLCSRVFMLVAQSHPLLPYRGFAISSPCIYRFSSLRYNSVPVTLEPQRHSIFMPNFASRKNIDIKVMDFFLIAQ